MVVGPFVDHRATMTAQDVREGVAKCIAIHVVPRIQMALLTVLSVGSH